jgi:hypothetical protein
MEAIAKEIPLLEQTQKLLPWHQQPGEPDNAFLAFEYFISLGPDRSITKLSGIYRKPVRTLYGYSTQYNWTIRAKKYDFLMSKLNNNTDLLELEHHANEVKKVRIEIAYYAIRALDELALKLNDFWSNYRNPEVIQKIKFLNLMSITMMRLLKLAKMDMPPDMINEQCNRDIDLNDFFDLSKDLSCIGLESKIAYREHMREVPHANYPVKSPYRPEPEPQVNIDDFLADLRKNDKGLSQSTDSDDLEDTDNFDDVDDLDDTLDTDLFDDSTELDASAANEDFPLIE